MIVRILGEGQFVVDDEAVEGLNMLDTEVERAVEEADEGLFARALPALLEEVRQSGRPVPDEDLVDSDLILPRSDSTLLEVTDLLGDDGLIPG